MKLRQRNGGSITSTGRLPVDSAAPRTASSVSSVDEPCLSLGNMGECIESNGTLRNTGRPTCASVIIRSANYWKLQLCLLWDWVFFEICVVAVKLAICLQGVPVLSDFTRRLTLMSGSVDTNANLCLFLRQLYSRAPPPLTYDAQEIYFGWMFLESQYKIWTWIVSRLSWRLLPPLVRPLFKAYYGRAKYARDFLLKCIEDFKVEQIVILGAGFDSNAYRCRDVRIKREGPVTSHFVRVFEVDRAEVSLLKLEGLRRHMSQAEYNYYTEGVIYVVCNFGVDSLQARLLEHGFNPRAATAVLWEGVTYYLDRSALRATLTELQELFSTSSPETYPIAKSQEVIEIDDQQRRRTEETTIETPFPNRRTSADRVSTNSTVDDITREDFSLETDRGIQSLTQETSEPSAVAPQPVYLFMDYMLETKTLDSRNLEKDRLWRLQNLLAEALGTRFLTGFSNISVELEEFGWKCFRHITWEDVEVEYFSNLPPELSVFTERNTTFGHNEPYLNCVECVFTDRVPSHWHN
eukprot:Gregarina_sp_Poly_1__3606@NODE_205_length_11479_cov_138_250613_g183_i0_p3_GENE_NODE_205_length_11479_cov_138_250613_g183_i0NODE_205_length_11479_cov_138_250613_g183_i0_p3_ORF_typecomplete_len522_score43_25LCM/PF04072_14/5_5e23_NODE_205_length_11479_cov_138_250613_g183_i014453010